MEKSQRRNISKHTIRYFFSAQWRHKGYVLGTFIATPLVILWRDVFFTYFLADIIAKVTENPAVDNVVQNILPEAILAIVLRVIFSIILGELRVYLHWRMEIYAINYLQNLCFDTVAAQSMQFHNDRFSGSLVSQVNKFTSSYELFMDVIIWDIFPVAVTIITSLVILYTRVPIIATVMLVFVISYITIAYLAFRKIAPLNEKMANEENKRTGQLADSITNITSVKSYAREAHEHKRFSVFSRNVANSTLDLLRTEIKRNCWFDFIYLGLTVAMLGFLLFGQGVFAVSFGTVILVFEYWGNITNYLWNFNNIFKHINRSLGDAREMTEILDLPDDVVDEKDATKLHISSGEINFSDVSFKHADAKNAIFENFNLNVKPGERVGLVGVSGSGKTTLTKLLLRFADVNKGEIKIDDQNIRFVTQQSLRENIAYVPQETALFHRSIAENIAYGKPDATKEEITRAAKLANAHEFVKDLPQGYDTLVGERGIKLSGGQRQRIAIARAILKDAPILVLDEATSALDSESEALIQSALSELMKNRTSIVIAHRLSTVANLDRIVVLENGKIVEEGTHRALLQKHGAYAKLWSRQSGAFLEEK